MTQSGKIFLIGGHRTLAKLCQRILKNGFNEYYITQKSQLKYKREEHSVCTIDKYLLVTGSFSTDLNE